MNRESLPTPQFSVVMPVFNVERYVEAAVVSVLQQTFRDFELIVSDDGSTDSTVAVVLRCAERDPRVRLLRRQANGGPGGNRNFAMQRAGAEWIAFLDGDDIWPPEHLSHCAEAIHACPAADIFFGDYRGFVASLEDAAPNTLEEKRFFDPHASYVQSIVRSANGDELFSMHSDRLLKFCCLYHCPISTQAVTLRRETMLRNKVAFREDWVINEDFHVWMRMLESGSAVAIRRVLFFYRNNPDSLTSDPIRYLEGMARSHGEWMRRIGSRLDEEERRIYRDKVAGFLHAAAWEHSRHGRVISATSAHLRSLRVRCQPADLVAVPRTVARALWWRMRTAFGGKLPA